jgi:hypothetical protein
MLWGNGLGATCQTVNLNLGAKLPEVESFSTPTAKISYKLFFVAVNMDSWQPKNGVLSAMSGRTLKISTKTDRSQMAYQASA